MENLNNKIYCRLERMSSWTGIITLFILAHLVLLSMMIFTFPEINDKLGTQAFDLKTFGYSESETFTMLQNLDKATVDIYIFPQLFFLDILYPVLLSLFLSALIIRLSNLTMMNRKGFSSVLYLLPFAAMVFNYLENGFIFQMITNSADVSTVVIKTASILTQLKGAFTMLNWTIIFILSGVWVKNKFLHRVIRNSSKTIAN